MLGTLALSSPSTHWIVEAANVLFEWGNTGKRPVRAELAQDLYTHLAQADDDRDAQGWLDWLKSRSVP